MGKFLRFGDRIESDGTGVSENAEQGFSDSVVKTDFQQFQMRPNDDYLFDDLFDDDGMVEQIVFEKKAVKDNPDNK